MCSSDLGGPGANGPDEGVWVPPAETEAYLAWKRERRVEALVRDLSPHHSAPGGYQGRRAPRDTPDQPQRSRPRGSGRPNLTGGDLREVIRLLREQSRCSPNRDLRDVLRARRRRTPTPSTGDSSSHSSAPRRRRRFRARSRSRTPRRRGLLEVCYRNTPPLLHY